MSSLVVRNIGELLTNDPTIGESPMGRRFNAAVVIDGGVVAWIGESAKAPAADSVIDAGGGAVLPGFVDSHTHLIFAGERSAEFEARMASVAYDGGGIWSTVKATRAASSEFLRRRSQRLRGEMLCQGTTTIEVKSGYELTVAGEQRLVEIASELSDEVTFLGAHTVPEEYASDRDGYIELVAGAMLDACSSHARWADVFCEGVAFSVDESRYVLGAAAQKGLGLRVHGNQLAHSGGIALAVEMEAASVDHCTHYTKDDVTLLTDSDVVASLLPAAEFSTRSPYPNARELLDAGVTVALATDCNPGTAFVTSMPFVVALAVREMSMTVDEALWAATLGGARALRRSDVGYLGLGACGDLMVLDAPRAAHVAYRPGSSLVQHVVRDGVATSFEESVSW
ncbi:MAG TPA: imidazolonepropionase [Acidimicrobiales bacterium]|nr:imidazolonepropionase [Acidimicrobiales bacterium]